MSSTSVRRASSDDLAALAPLFDAYRQFYGYASAPDAASGYLGDRLAHGQSVIFLAENGAAAVGFTQLYPSFCSLDLSPIFVLYDLFVSPDARGTGAGKALLETARQYGADHGASRLELSTALDNTGAQALYENLGWVKDTAYYHYELPLAQ